jgi:S1-C subfamily serine protease
MNAFDLLVLVLLALAAIAGARAGFLSPVIGLGGAVLGFAFALLAASVLHEPLAQVEQPARALITLLGLGAFVLAGEASGAAIGATLSRGIRSGPLRPLDMAGGAIVGAAHVVLLVWLVGGLLATGVSPILGPAARDSVAIRVTGERLPPPGAVAGRIMDLLATTDLPGLFAGLEPPPAAPVDLPADSQVGGLAESAIASTARITSAGCGALLSVGSGFFVGREHAVTNAHVVAGSTTTTVRLGGADLEAAVVAFDPSSDLALLFVPGAGAAPLGLSTNVPARGTPAAVIGFPGGGDLTVTAAAVTATHNIVAPDIYGEGSYSHSAVELRSAIQRGNSGGPLVVAPGTVGGVVFGASTNASDVGYAIGADEARESIGPYIGSTTAVGTGACL